MSKSNGYEVYRRVGLETASAPRLLLALYDGAIRFLDRATAAIEAGDHEIAHNSIVRGEDIITELLTTLDLSYGELPEQLRDLYVYCYASLCEANQQKDVAKVREIAGLLRNLREGWRGAVAAVEQDPTLLQASTAGIGGAS